MNFNRMNKFVERKSPTGLMEAAHQLLPCFLERSYMSLMQGTAGSLFNLRPRVDIHGLNKFVKVTVFD